MDFQQEAIDIENIRSRILNEQAKVGGRANAILTAVDKALFEAVHKLEEVASFAPLFLVRTDVVNAGKFDLIERYIRENEKIKAIKEFRSVTGLGLKESKDQIEMMIARQYVTIILFDEVGNKKRTVNVPRKELAFSGSTFRDELLGITEDVVRDWALRRLEQFDMPRGIHEVEEIRPFKNSNTDPQVFGIYEAK